MKFYFINNYDLLIAQKCGLCDNSDIFTLFKVFPIWMEKSETERACQLLSADAFKTVKAGYSKKRGTFLYIATINEEDFVILIGR